jgi:hypothetical protein
VGKPEGGGKFKQTSRAAPKKACFPQTPQEDALSCHSSAIRLKASNKNPTQETTLGQGPHTSYRVHPTGEQLQQPTTTSKQHPSTKINSRANETQHESTQEQIKINNDELANAHVDFCFCRKWQSLVQQSVGEIMALGGGELMTKVASYVTTQGSGTQSQS